VDKMAKYVSFKIFDSEDHPYGFEGIKDKQVKKRYTWVHEDYYVGIIKAELDRNNRDPEYWAKLDESIRKAENEAQD